MNKLLVVLAFLSLLCSCSEKQQTDGEVVLKVTGLNGGESPSVSELFSSIEAIPLETGDGCLLKHVEKVFPCKSGYFVFDNLKPALYLFDESGEFLREIAGKGDGPGMFQLVSDFVADEENGYIALLSPFGFLLEYDREGNFKNKVFLPSKPNYQTIALMDGGKNLALWSCVESEEDGVTIINRRNHAPAGSYWRNDRILDMSLPAPFYLYGGNTFFGSAFQHKVYRLQPDTLVCDYSWDFGSEGIDEKKLSAYTDIEHGGERNRKLLQDLKDGILPYSMERHAQNSRYYYVALRSGVGLNRPFKNVFYDKRTGHSWVFEKLKEGISLHPFFLTDDCLVALLPYEEIELYRELLDGSEYAKISAMKEDDNPCLLKFNFRR